MSGDYRDGLAAARERLERLEEGAAGRALARLRAERLLRSPRPRLGAGHSAVRIGAAFTVLATLRMGIDLRSTTSSIAFACFVVALVLLFGSIGVQLAGLLAHRRTLVALDATEARFLAPRVRVATGDLGEVHARIAALEAEEDAEHLRESARTA